MTGPNDTEERAARIAASVKDRLAEKRSSRRGFLGRTALLGGALVALGSATGNTIAQQEEDEEPETEETDAGAAFDDVEGTDVDVLNYALSLEHLENAFYREALEEFDEDDFADAELLSEYDEEIRTTIFSHVEMIAEHEAAHVEVLSQAIELLGGTPAEEASYDFGYEDVDEFLETAQVLENTGVATYQGAAPFVESPDLLSAALSIHSVEARHAALLNEVTGESPFPDAFDPAQSQSEVLDAVEGFIETDEADEDEEDGEDEEDEEETAEDEEDGEEADDEEETETETETGEAPGTETETGEAPMNETATEATPTEE
ncbi:ferritin-like domain-containing protein [Halobellus rufus]|uniref:ferritin-like domain-containing protein n=1 Tax=Halobellus rufus TaxID=1448860 RepID=UPI0009DD7506|nr:ferritin-like domain-containing protein [Halobellus rufus]